MGSDPDGVLRVGGQRRQRGAVGDVRRRLPGMAADHRSMTQLVGVDAGTGVRRRVPAPLQAVGASQDQRRRVRLGWRLDRVGDDDQDRLGLRALPAAGAAACRYLKLVLVVGPAVGRALMVGGQHESQLAGVRNGEVPTVVSPRNAVSGDRVRRVGVIGSDNTDKGRVLLHSELAGTREDRRIIDLRGCAATTTTTSASASEAAAAASEASSAAAGVGLVGVGVGVGTVLGAVQERRHLGAGGVPARAEHCAVCASHGDLRRGEAGHVRRVPGVADDV